MLLMSFILETLKNMTRTVHQTINPDGHARDMSVLFKRSVMLTSII